MSPTTLRWHLEDFNAGQDPPRRAEEETQAPLPEAAEEEPKPADSWMEGYLHAIRHAALPEPRACPKEGLTLALQEMEDRLRDAAEASTTLLAGLLLKATLAACGRNLAGDWQAQVQRMSDVIRPALLAAQPKLTLQAENGDVVLAATAIEGVGDKPFTSASCDRACLSWRLGRAEYSTRTAMEEAALALAPLIIDTVTAENRCGREDLPT